MSVIPIMSRCNPYRRSVIAGALLVESVLLPFDRRCGLFSLLLWSRSSALGVVQLGVLPRSSLRRDTCSDKQTLVFRSGVKWRYLKTSTSSFYLNSPSSHEEMVPPEKPCWVLTCNYSNIIYVNRSLSLLQQCVNSILAHNKATQIKISMRPYIILSHLFF